MQVKSYQGGSVGQVDFDEVRFHDKGGKARVLYRTLKDAVVMHLANQRQGTVGVKNRADIKGSNKKLYRQKGTGRARAGSVKSPIRRGGGVAFGPQARDYSYHMPAKARRLATRTAILGKLQDNEVVIADLSGFAAPSAKAARKVLADLGSPRRALILLAEPNENVWKSFRNFPLVNIRNAQDVCSHDVVAGGLIITEAAALEAVAKRVGRDLEAEGAQA